MHDVDIRVKSMKSFPFDQDMIQFELKLYLK